MKISSKIKRLSKIFQSNGYQCFLVGGAVRDIFLKRETSDYDIATDAEPDDVKKIFKIVIPTGIKHGTVTVIFHGDKFEVTTFRIDDKYSDNRRPDSVKYTGSITDDLKRRDFTVNAIAYDLINREIADPHNGIKDIKHKVIKAVGDPFLRFNEDGLRVMRACRFAAQLKFIIEKRTLSAIKKSIKCISSISEERIRDEFVKIILSDNPVYGIELLKDTGLLNIIIPELYNCIGIEQREMHCFDVYYHSLYSLYGVKDKNIILRLAALFHDLGKVKAYKYTDKNSLTFYSHEKYSEDLAGNILKRLKFSNKVINDICHLIRHHMFNYTEEWTDSAVRRFISKTGIEYIEDLLKLRKADSFGRCRKIERNKNLEYLIERIKKIKNEENIFSLKDLNITGKDIIDKLNIKQGPVIGVILNYLLDSVLDDPELNYHEKLLELSEKLYFQRINLLKSQDKKKSNN